MTVPVGCRSQGCPGCLLGLLAALLLFHQAPSIHPPIADGFNHSLHGNKYYNSLSSFSPNFAFNNLVFTRPRVMYMYVVISRNRQKCKCCGSCSSKAVIT